MIIQRPTEEEILSIQNVARKTSSYPGLLVIPKTKLAKLIQTKINKPFHVKHLNMAIESYCHRGYAMKITIGAKKYNAIAEKVPDFLDWFFDMYSESFYSHICMKFENSSLEGVKHNKKRADKNQPSKVKP